MVLRSRRNQPAHFQIAKANDGDRLLEAGPIRCNPAARRPAMKPMAWASLAANTASTPGRFASAATLPDALRPESIGAEASHQAQAPRP